MSLGACLTPVAGVAASTVAFVDTVLNAALSSPPAEPFRTVQLTTLGTSEAKVAGTDGAVKAGQTGPSVPARVRLTHARPAALLYHFQAAA